MIIVNNVWKRQIKLGEKLKKNKKVDYVMILMIVLSVIVIFSFVAFIFYFFDVQMDAEKFCQNNNYTIFERYAGTYLAGDMFIECCKPSTIEGQLYECKILQNKR